MKAFACILALASVAQSVVVSPLTAGLPLTYGYGLGAPLTYAAAPAHVTYANAPAQVTYANAPAIAAPTIAAPVYAAAAPQIASSQYRQQDEFGNSAFGYSNINSARQEAGNSLTGVRGSYSYVDANGILQTTNYVADDLGFRVQATNLPVAPIANLAQPIHALAGPAPVEKTADVKAAEAEFFAKFAEAASRTKRSVIAPYAATPLNYGLPLAATPLNYGLPLAAATPLNYGLPLAAAPLAAAPLAAAPVAAAPVAAAAPVGAQEGILTKIQNNPGFAVSYRVD